MHGVTANNKTFRLEDLDQFAASESVWRHYCNREILYSEGVRYVVERCHAYQLLDEIALAQDNQPAL